MSGMVKNGALPPSLWAATATAAQDFPRLQGVHQADVVIVGGGFTGLSAALHLAEAGIKALVLEAHEPGWGASGRNGGQVIPGLKYDPDELERHFGGQVVKTAGGGPDLVFSLIEKHAIDCHPVRKGWIQPAHDKKALGTVLSRAGQWAKRGVDMEILEKDRLDQLMGTGFYAGGWIDKRGGGIQPLSYARGLAAAAAKAGAGIHGDSPVKALSRGPAGWIVETGHATVTAQKVILATNGYTDHLWPGLAKTVVPVYSFQIATRPLGDNVRRSILPEGQVASDTRRLLWYYRLDHQGRLLMGGRGPFKETPGFDDAGSLKSAISRLYPQVADDPLEFVWAGKVAMTQDHLPHLHVLADGLYAGLGFNGRGVAMGTVMGRMLALLAGGADPRDVPFPITAMKPMAFHRLHRPAVMAIAEYYKIRDALEARFGPKAA